MLFPVFSTTGARRGRGNTPVVFPMMGNRGFIVEMDDFGSGYSSLNALKDIDIDKLKLDMRFLWRCLLCVCYYASQPKRFMSTRPSGRSVTPSADRRSACSGKWGASRPAWFTTRWQGYAP